DVTLLGRQRHMAAIAADGLQIDGIWGAHQVHTLHTAATASAIAGRFDAILVTVKSFDTAAMGRTVGPWLADGGVIISLQNGLGNVETLEDVVGAERVLGARVIFGAVLLAPGQVRVTVIADPTAVGARVPAAYPQRDAQARAWAACFDAAGVPSH